MKFIFGRADEAGDEEIVGIVVERQRRADLLDAAVAQHDDLVGQRHRLDLVVRHVDHGGAEALVQLGDLDAHLHAQLGIEIGERLVEQEDCGLAHDGAADSDALALAAGKLPRLAVAADRRAAGCAAALSTRCLISALRQPRHPQAEAHVLATVICG